MFAVDNDGRPDCALAFDSSRDGEELGKDMAPISHVALVSLAFPNFSPLFFSNPNPNPAHPRAQI